MVITSALHAEARPETVDFFFLWHYNLLPNCSQLFENFEFCRSENKTKGKKPKCPFEWASLIFFLILTKLVFLIANRSVSRNVRVRETIRLFTISWRLNVIFYLNAGRCLASQLFFLSPKFYILSHIPDFANIQERNDEIIFVRKTISKFCFLNNFSAFFEK